MADAGGWKGGGRLVASAMTLRRCHAAAHCLNEAAGAAFWWRVGKDMGSSGGRRGGRRRKMESMFNPSTSSPLPQLKPIQPKRRRKAKSALSGADARAASGAVCALPDYDCLRRYEEHLRLRGKAGRTREEYLRYARKLAQLGRCDPATLTEARIRAFFLYLKEHLKYAPSSLQRIVERSRWRGVLVASWKGHGRF